MASFKGDGRGRNSKRRDGQRRLAMESLESRRLLDGGGLNTPPTWRPTNHDLTDVKNGPLALAGQDLINIYQEYLAYERLNNGSAFVSRTNSYIEFNGNFVGIDIRGYGDPTTFQTSLRNIGFQVSNVLAQPNETYVEGFLPIGQIPTAASLTQIIGMAPIYRPVNRFKGTANNEADTAQRSDKARTQYGVDGTGVTIGVLSDSVSKVAGGLADSVKTGDLPNNVNVLTDGATGDTDEGRAMLENIYDIAPGATLAFSTADGGEAAFAQHIRDLATQANAKVIVDDIGYFLEPVFQDGIIGKAINDVAAQNNVSYFSAEGNSGSSGYESPFRGVTANVTGVGQGRYFNFNPNGGTLTNLPITVGGANASISLQWDNPFYTTNGVVTSLNLYILDANNNVVASGTTNAIATQIPGQLINKLAAGNYTVAVQVAAGPDPGRIRLTEVTEVGVVFSQQFGNAGGIFYPNTNGHPYAAESIGTGAVPWWATASYINQQPLKSEPFSSLGPATIVFNPDGSRISTPQTRLTPTISTADGGNTSFFGSPLDTTKPPFPGEPATTTNLAQPNLPAFFGTSAAAPNAAAVAALMLQRAPASSRVDIRNALIASAIPLNGTVKGAWDPQGGYGMVDAVAALASIDNLRVVSITPGGGSSVAVPPTFITVTFSKPIDFSTLQPGALTVTGPAGVTVTLGQPIAVDDPSFPTVIKYPFSFTRQPGVNANGTFTESFAAGGVRGRDGKPNLAFTDTFRLADTVAPTITGTTFSGRIVRINFSAPLDPSTINRDSIRLYRGTRVPVTSNTLVTNDPRAIIRYDAASNSVTIDLTALDQSLLPTDVYTLIVVATNYDGAGRVTNPGVTDLVGNGLDGEYSGRFPTGEGVAGGNFVQSLGVQTLSPPVFNGVALNPNSDSGIKGDQNTNVRQPTLNGQLGANFPGTVANLVVLVEFNGIPHNNASTGAPLPIGSLDLTPGVGGRGYSGNYDVLTTTDAAGRFFITAPANLPDGLNRVRFLAIGQTDRAPLPGLSSTLDISFRVDTSRPMIDTSGSHPSGASLPNNTAISSLPNLTLYFTDPVQPSALNSPFAVPTQLSLPALDPTAASNISNYSLYLVQGSNIVDESSFIKTAAFTSTSNRRLTTDPYTGTVNLTFGTGFPAGHYVFVAHTSEPGFSGLTDAAGNPLQANPSKPNNPQNYYLSFDFQPQPAFITYVRAVSPDGTLSGPRSYFEVPAPGAISRAAAPPTSFIVDFSNPLPAGIDYTNAIQLIGSADTPGGTADGNFGTLGTSNDGTGYSRVAGTRVTLGSSDPRAQAGQPGYHDRLTLTLPAGSTLPPDYYRLYIPNSGSNKITDAFGNQLDGEFLGNKKPDGTYEDLLPNGQYRQGLSGDGLPGGAFVTGYVVVPNGNIIYAKPDYQDDPFLTTDDPDGSLAKPYPTLAPQAAPNAINGGDLNAQSNFGTGFDPRFDREGSGRFDRSALFAAQQRSSRGPVVVVALPATVIRDPNTGQTTQKAFVIQAPSGNDPVTGVPRDASVAIPALTTLAFAPGAILKMQNAALFVQNQGSALQMNGGPNPSDQVNVTSYNDNSVGGQSTPPGSSTPPRGGDYGGLVFRNYDETNRSSTFPGQIPTLAGPGVDGRLKGPNGADAVSGADDVMSVIDNARIRYAGGAVPQTTNIGYDAITMLNSRPAITNDVISEAGNATSVQAAISVNVDALREDEVARGPLIRRVTMVNNNLNGIFIRAEQNGVAEPTNAVNYPLNPSTMGGARNFVLNSPYPYLLTSRLVMGDLYLQERGGSLSSEPDRLYVQPGMMVKLERGAAIEVNGSGIGARQPSLNVGDRTYINQFDASANFSPLLPNGQPNPSFKPNTTGDARILFTSILDDTASTSYFDPVTQITTPIVSPLPSSLAGAGSLQPTPGNVSDAARWGSITVFSPGVAVIDEADIRYGGGTVNTLEGSIQSGPRGRHAIELAGAFGSGQNGSGTHVSITNNNLTDNADVAMNTTADGLFAGDPLRPLQSGKPFFRGNVLQRNGYNGLGVLGSRPGLREDSANNVNTVWDNTDLTYIVRETITMGPFLGNLPPLGSETGFGNVPKPSVTLTVQSLLPNTMLANGQRVARPGESPIIKLLGAGPTTAFTSSPNILAEDQQGAGFVSGMDNGVDPTADPLIDVGVYSQMRFVGIPGNESTGQQRVPVIITSVHDSTVGTTVRGVRMYSAIDGDSTAPKAGDGGNITFGSYTAPSFNLYDPRLGNLIDNADIRYITRIEQIGSGILRLYDTTGKNGFDAKIDQPYQQRNGLPVPIAGGPNGQTTTYGTQYNSANAMTISDSNLASFRDIGVWAHPGFTPVAIPMNYPGMIARGPIPAEPTRTFFVNDTISNMPTGVAIDTVTSGDDSTTYESPSQAVFLNSTFYNNGIGINSDAGIANTNATPVRWNGRNALAHVNFIAMNNIFANHTTAAIQLQGQQWESQTQYNLYNNNAADVVGANNVDGWRGDNQAVHGDPQFLDAANGNFFVGPNSAAINASRSEIGPLQIGNILNPAVFQVLGPEGGVRNPIGGSNPYGGVGFIRSDQDFVTLPGFPIRSFRDQWVPALQGTPGAYTGPSSNPATYPYMPLGNGTNDEGGQRDGAGYLRTADPNKPIKGFGRNPFYTIGAFQFRQLFPPHVTAVTATFTDPNSPTGASNKSIYQVGGISGTNVPPTAIQIQFDAAIDPNTLNASTVLLDESSDGQFTAGNVVSDRPINLAGKLSYDPLNHILTINLGASGLTLATDEYRVRVLGTGSAVVRDPSGNALDGENLDANGNQTPLPSGNGFPGGNFQVTFTVDTNSPSIVAGTFSLDPAADSNRKDGITDTNTPNFQGTITDVFPPTNFLQNQTVHIDVSTRGDGVFDIIDAGVGTTDINGRFSVKITKPLRDSPYNVGPDGIFYSDLTRTPPVRSTDDSGYSVARVRIANASGNASNINDPNALTTFVIDTAGPRITAVSPRPNTLANVASNGTVPFTITFDKNVDPATINANTIRVVRSGGDGVFGNGNDVPLTIDTTSFVYTYLHTPKGAEQVSFNVVGASGAALANDVYRVTVVGTGASPVTDVAGNALDGEYNGVFPTGDGVPGGDFNPTFVVFSPSLVNHLFVGGFVTDGTRPLGSRANPYPTIVAAITAAQTGDVVAVLPGVYNESVTLKSLVTLASASTASTDTNLIPGDPLQTILRPAAPTGTTPSTTVTGRNITSVLGGVLNTEVTGFTIASPLQGDPSNGPIQPGSTGLFLANSDILVDRNYFIDSAVGASVYATGANAPLPRFVNDGFIGNTTGLGIVGSGASTLANAGQVDNNTFAFNDTGIIVSAAAGTPVLANIDNNIFWQNHDLTGARAGFAVGSNVANKVVLRSNLFSGNGPNQNSSAGSTVNVGNGFDPAALRANAPDSLGNLAGVPAFVAPRDPRPTADGPAVFFLDANFDLTLNSSAIDRANPAFAPPLDFRYRGRATVPGRAFPGTGPADIGAFEFRGTGGLPAGGRAFRVATTSLLPDGVSRSGGASVPYTAAPASLDVSFSANVDRNSVVPSDLILSGDGISRSNPVRATSLTWIDDHTVRFNLAGGYNRSGVVTVDIPQGSIRDQQGRGLTGLRDSIRLAPTAPAQTTAVPQHSVVATPVVIPGVSPTAKKPTVATVRRGRRVH